MILFPNLTYPMTLTLILEGIGVLLDKTLLNKHTDRQIIWLRQFKESTSHKLNRQTHIQTDRKIVYDIRTRNQSLVNWRDELIDRKIVLQHKYNISTS